MTNNISLGGVSKGYKPFVIKDLILRHKKIIIICDNEEEAFSLKNQLSLLLKDHHFYLFPKWDCLSYDDTASPSLYCMAKRLCVLHKLLTQQEKTHVITTISACTQRILAKECFDKTIVHISINKKYPRCDLEKTLRIYGYELRDMVLNRGEYAIRGSLIDIFSPSLDFPIRIDYFDEIIEEIRIFNPVTQRTIEHKETIDLIPTREILLKKPFNKKISQNITDSLVDGHYISGIEHYYPLFYEKQNSIFDYTNDYFLIFDDQSNKLFETIEKERLEIYENIENDHPLKIVTPTSMYINKKEWTNIRNQHESCNISPYCISGAEDLGSRILLNVDPSNFLKIIHQKKQEKKVVIIASTTKGVQYRIEQILKANKVKEVISLETWPTSLDYKNIYSVIFPINEAFKTHTWVILTTKEILGHSFSERIIKKTQNHILFKELQKLIKDDLIVHREHGIGRYIGLKTVSVDNYTYDCLVLLYEGGDKLFLPVENIDLITRYGEGIENKKLDRLGGKSWHLRKEKVQKYLENIASDLIKTASERILLKSQILSNTAEEFNLFCSKFPYVETKDQDRAISEVLNDMASGNLMDRLICGDVGFGKTEIAMRAAYIAVSHGMQVLIFVPTTLLCHQHFHTFKKRFAKFPYRIEQLSRLVSQQKARQIKDDINSGKVNIIIATHAILSVFKNGHPFHNLGLIVIDEEQHFGVKQKEKLKELKSDVHMLTLTATPIPRTLQLSLSGLKDISIIATPPINRLAVRTFITFYDKKVVQEAIERECNRGGQVFYIAPRIEHLEEIKKDLDRIFPNINKAVAHGRISPLNLENIIKDFHKGLYRILIATHIIESGLDIPNVNTLIVHRPDLFGLSQLYQLRGRVGRAGTQAFAYFLLPKKKLLSENAIKRLEVLQSLDTLGAGLQLASHDMDIRGAGNLLGAEQSGHIHDVGVELYQYLLTEAINELKAQEEGKNVIKQNFSPCVRIGKSALIPKEYISDITTRLNIYRRFSSISTKEDMEDFIAELIDRFGQIPKEIENLKEVILLKNLCKKANITQLEVGKNGITIAFYNNVFRNTDALLSFLQSKEGSQLGVMKVSADQKLTLIKKWSSIQLQTKACFYLVNKIVVL
ncbi:MAG: transcription-repair coupling factor [Alphaproteobacteria bacterium]